MKASITPEDDRFTPVQLTKGLAILMAALLWPVVPLLAAGFGLYEIYKLAVLDEWDSVWVILLGPSVLGIALWFNASRARNVVKGGSDWQLPGWMKVVYMAVVVVCVGLFVLALGIDISRV
ncbi:MAG: hypothetical protein ABWZ88_03670 [Variovorax sp.]